MYTKECGESVHRSSEIISSNYYRAWKLVIMSTLTETRPVRVANCSGYHGGQPDSMDAFLRADVVWQAIQRMKCTDRQLWEMLIL